MTPNENTSLSAQMVVRRGLEEIPLDSGDCLIGRDPDCAMRLDDPMISRKHAKISVESGTATITDLSSANGVYVNGRRVLGATALRPGDHILIGKEEMHIASFGAASAALPDQLHQLTRDTLRLEPPPTVTSPQTPDVTSRVDTFGLIAKVVDRVLAEGRGSDAERMLAPQLDVLLREVVRRGSLPPETSTRAAEYAVKLAAATGQGKWVDYVIQMHTASLRPLPAGLVGLVLSAAKTCADFDRTAMRSYISRLLSSAERLTPSERSDLETLGGLAGAASPR